ncbi:MAG: glucose-6-phosphate isomerase [Firmicutes bacterium]|nr:glucose-6-phosphate isomerase [Bacillota bacterium]
MSELRFSYQGARPFLSEHELEYLAPAVRLAHERLHSRQGPGSDFLGWVDLPLRPDREELERIKAAAARIREQADVLVVIGVGGSYMGARAVIEALGHPFHNLLPRDRRPGPAIYYAGHNLSSTYLQRLLEMLEGQEVAVNVISKSGTTTEPAVAFRLVKALMERKYGKEEARRRIYVTTDRAKGALRQLAEAEGYERFVVPDDVGGRYSVLTAVGLLPIAAAGIDIDRLLAGAARGAEAYRVAELEQNPAYQYAAVRTALYHKGRLIELLVSYEPMLHYVAEWWKQLFGESEGKDGKGIFPASADFTTDLHSLGQYIQEGRRHLFETVLWVEEPPADLTLPSDPGNADGLEYLAGTSVHSINRRAQEGTILAHVDGGVPNLQVILPALTPEHLGQVLYFFEKACAVSGYLLGVNPFDQPGVEAYKRNMFALLGKPGFEAERQKLLARLEEGRQG